MTYGLPITGAGASQAASAEAHNAEVNAAIAAAVNAEADLRETADIALMTGISTEATLREAADTAETAARVSADNTETVARISGDAALVALANLGDVIRLVDGAGTAQAATFNIRAEQAALTPEVGSWLAFEWPVQNTGADPVLTVGALNLTLKSQAGGVLEAGDLRAGATHIARIHSPGTARVITLTRISTVIGLAEALAEKIGADELAAALSAEADARADDVAAMIALAQLGDPIRLVDGVGGAQAASFAVRDAQEALQVVNGSLIEFVWPEDNTGAGPVLTVSDLALTLQTARGGALQAGDLRAGQRHLASITSNSTARVLTLQRVDLVNGLPEALAAKADLADLAAAQVGREPAPGVQPSRFLRWIEAGSARWSSANRQITAAGPALVVTGAGYVVLDDPVPVQAGDVEELSFAVIRTAAVVDPAGEGIRFGVACYDADGVPLTGANAFVAVGADVLDLNAAGAVATRHGAVSRTLQDGIDVVLPAAARLIAPAVRAFGGNPGLGVLQCERHRVPTTAVAGATVRADAAGTLAGRAAYDAKPSGFVYLRTDGSQWEYYTRTGAAGTWAGPNTFRGPAGSDGADGDLTTFANEAAALAWLGAASRPDGLVISVAGLDYITRAGGPGTGLLAAATPRRPSYPQQWGWVGNGTAADTQKFQNAILEIGAAGGGELTVPPGSKALACITPGATNWDNRYALRIAHDDVAIKGMAGAKLTLASGETGHMIIVGQRADGSLTPKRARIEGLHLDMARADKPDYAAGARNSAVIISDNCDYFTVQDCVIENGVHYGIGVQRSEIKYGTIRGCKIIGSGADGIDWKNDTSQAKGNVVDGCIVMNWGQDATIAAGGQGPQAAFDFRSGVMGTNLVAIIDDELTVDRDGIRIQGGNPGETPWQPTQIVGFAVIGKSRDLGTTRGVRIISRWGKVSSGHVRWVSDGISISTPECRVSDVDAYFCTAGVRLWWDTSFTPAGTFEGDQTMLRGIVARNNTYGIVLDSIDNAQLDGCHFMANGTGIDIRTGTSNTRIFGGSCFGNTTANLSDAGTNPVIDNVAGITTRSRRTQAFPITATGVQTFTLTHGLGFTLAAADVTATISTVGGVTNFAAVPMVTNVTATEVTVAVNVIAASATPGATANVTLEIDARKVM